MPITNPSLSLIKTIKIKHEKWVCKSDYSLAVLANSALFFFRFQAVFVKVCPALIKLQS